MVLRIWSAAVFVAPIWVAVSALWLPHLVWFRYLGALPSAGLASAAMLRRYRRTLDPLVALKQAAVTAWMLGTVLMTGFVLFDASSYSCVLYFCDAENNLTIVFGFLFWSIVLSMTTVAYPAIFMVVNLYKGWHVSAFVGACGLGFEVTSLAYFSQSMTSQRSTWPTWRFSGWLVLAALVVCCRLSFTLAARALAKVRLSWKYPAHCPFHNEVTTKLSTVCDHLRDGVAPEMRPKGEQSFVLPPLLPPTMSSRAFEPEHTCTELRRRVGRAPAR